ncbi:MAG: acyl--CoA ligase [Clostridia bacterium]|nr:acyl--CoA ligase [Clostridia bacterium]
MPITEFLEKNAEAYGNEVCLVEVNPDMQKDQRITWKDYSLVEPERNSTYRKEITWLDFDRKANKIANFLIKEGIKKGDKVAILLMNCLEWLPIYFGTLKAGALAVPLNYRYSSDEIKYCLDLADADALVFGKEFIGRVENICSEIPKVKALYFVGEDCPTFAVDFERALEVECDKKPDISISDEDYSAIYFSSGTTGFPKAILHKHASLMQAAITEQKHHSQSRKDVFLCIPPLYHTGAKMHWFGSLVSGSKAVLLKGVSPKWIVQTASIEKASIVWLLVPWAQDILDAIDSGEIDLKEYDLSAWRLMHIGAQPVPPSLIQRWLSKFPTHEYDTNYGLSESIGPGCVHLGVENIHKVGAIGKAGYGWQVKIVGFDGKEVERGDVGELAVKGAGVMTCYYKDEKATADVLKDGWLYTGDMAKEDEDGFIYLVDRKKDVIITGGENLYPVQIEDYLRKHEGIRDVAVIGMPDERLGEIASAIIELKPEYVGKVSEEDVNAFCAGLPRYKRPRKVIFDTVPRNPTGKIEKPKLRAKYCVDKLVEVQTTK